MMSRGVRGFTLVELLVGITLLSVIILILGSSMRSLAQLETRIDDRSARLDELRVFSTILRQTLGRVSASEAPPARADAHPSVQFFGGVDRIEWVGIMPARPGAGGRNFFRLVFVPNDDGLVFPLLEFAEWHPNQDLVQVVYTDSRRLMPAIRAYRIQYEDMNSAADPVWLSTWDKPELPKRVRIDLDSGRQPGWVPIVIALRPLSASERSRNIFSSGPGS